MTVSEQEIMFKASKEEEDLKIKINKKFLNLFKEICEENELDVNKELNSRLENALVDSFNKYHSKCVRKRRSIGFVKGGKHVKRIPGFDPTQIEKILEKKESIEEKIEWLKTYLKHISNLLRTALTSY